MENIILIINPGSTSTKVAIFKNDQIILDIKINHPTDIIQSFSSVASQFSFRKEVILSSLQEKGFDLGNLTAVCGRGGMLDPLESGTYLINEKMLTFLKEAKRGEHASNLGALIAFDIGQTYQIPAFIVDPVAVDEMEPIARISGMPVIERQCIFHALNHKAIGRQVAFDHQKRYEDLNMIIVHLGGGISVAAHQKGRVIDVNDALDGDGPMSPERSGSVPLGPLYKLCFSGQYTLDDIKRMNYGKGGLVAYLGTNDAKEVVKRIEQHDEYAKLIYDAMIYQIAKEIGACSTIFKGDFDFIVLTGGLAFEKYLVSHLIERIKFLGEVLVYPGENEMLSLALGALRVLNKEELPKTY